MPSVTQLSTATIRTLSCTPRPPRRVSVSMRVFEAMVKRELKCFFVRERFMRTLVPRPRLSRWPTFGLSTSCWLYQHTKQKTITRERERADLVILGEFGEEREHLSVDRARSELRGEPAERRARGLAHHRDVVLAQLAEHPVEGMRGEEARKRKERAREGGTRTGACPSWRRRRRACRLSRRGARQRCACYCSRPSPAAAATGQTSPPRSGAPPPPCSTIPQPAAHSTRHQHKNLSPVMQHAA